jgi:hypothetical protein
MKVELLHIDNYYILTLIECIGNARKSRSGGGGRSSNIYSTKTNLNSLLEESVSKYCNFVLHSINCMEII